MNQLMIPEYVARVGLVITTTVATFELAFLRMNGLVVQLGFGLGKGTIAAQVANKFGIWLPSFVSSLLVPFKQGGAGCSIAALVIFVRLFVQVESFDVVI